MINFFLCQNHAYAVASLLREWDKELRSEFRLLGYESTAEMLYNSRSLTVHSGTIIFADVDRLLFPMRDVAQIIADCAKKNGTKIINEPRKVLRRFELLRALYEEGINEFNVYKYGEKIQKFPVFVRMAVEHNGSLSNLLYSQTMVDRQFEELRALGIRLEDLLIVEYKHTADRAGIFRKYSAFMIGDTLVPRHLLFSREWVTKVADNLPDPQLKREEIGYVDSMPHPQEALLRRVFEIANISYGRVDYGISDGKLHIWEINTNPVIMSAKKDVDLQRMPLQIRIAERIGQAFRKLSSDSSDLQLLAQGHEFFNKVPNSMPVALPALPR
ncbi:MAG TPA: hypothetical protein V6C81_04495 [Planktothrix sp.]|jgi:hypothetical protein